MSGHPDRLAGLVVLSAVATGIPTVAVRGVRATSLARAVGVGVDVTDVSTPGGGAVVAAPDPSDAAAQLEALLLAAHGDRPGLVWVLWDGHRRYPTAVQRVATRAGLEAMGTFRYVGSWASPTHLVRVGPEQALRWFATSVRPRWGRRSRLARVGNYLPRIGHHFFDGTAVLLVPTGSAAPPWPGADLKGPADAPAVLHLGGGATAGRLVLTWADGSGVPTHHTKLAPGHQANDVVAEAKALTVLAGLPSVTGTVPTLLGLRHGPTWAALTASHLPGRPARPALVRSVLGRVVRAPGEGCDADAAVTAWLAELSRASQGQTDSMATAPASSGASADRLALAVASLDDAVLQSVVLNGLDLGRTSSGLLHGDLWRGNVHTVRVAGGHSRIAVLDWESAMVGHPLVDLLTWLVSGAARDGQVRQGALDVLSVRDGDRPGGDAAVHVGTLLASVGQPLDASETEALVVAQMVVIAVSGGPAGGDGDHERAWLAAVSDVWAAWQRTGSPWSAPREVAR
jgi:hypothetical protein